MARKASFNISEQGTYNGVNFNKVQRVVIPYLSNKETNFYCHIINFHVSHEMEFSINIVCCIYYIVLDTTASFSSCNKFWMEKHVLKFCDQLNGSFIPVMKINYRPWLSVSTWTVVLSFWQELITETSKEMSALGLCMNSSVLFFNEKFLRDP